MKFKSQVKLTKDEIVQAILEAAKKKSNLPLTFEIGSLKWDITGGYDPYDMSHFRPYGVYSATIDVTMETE